jgi:outer membrane protein
MRYKKLLISLILSLSFFINCYSQNTIQDSLSLKDAIKLTLTNQPLLQQALEQVNAAEAKIKEQKSYYYPTIDGELSYTRIGPIPSIEFGGIGFSLAPENNYDMHVTASELLYDFGKRNALVDLSETYKLSSKDKISLIKNNLSFQTIQAFYTILFLKKSIDVENEQINTLEKHLEITNKRMQSGSATDFDILTTQVKVADAQNQKIDIENTLNKEIINLKNLLGLTSDSPLSLKGEFEIDSTSYNIESLLNKAFNNRPEIKLAKDAERSANVSKQVASLTDKPTLRIIGSYGLKNGYEPNLEVLRGNWAAGINASIPIFNGNLNDSKIEEADANLKSSSAKILELQRNIKTEVEQADADLKANKLKIKTSGLQVEHAMQAVSRAEAQYQNGIITNLDLIDTETSLAQARLQQLQIIYRNVLSNYNLRKAVGDILEE